MGKFFDKYLPVNLPTEFKKDGIKVKFTAKVAVQDIIKLVILHVIDQEIPIDRALPIRIIDIEKIPDENKCELVLAAEPLELTKEVFKVDPEGEPLPVLTPMDDKIHMLYEIGTEVHIAAEENIDNFVFSHFSGNGIKEEESMNPEITITMDSDKNIIAHYDEIIEKQPPEASFKYSPSSPIAGETVYFDASGSSDPDGQIVLYEWDFDCDDRHADDPTPQFVFEEPGRYDVTLKVTDNDELTDEITRPVVVRSQDEPEPGVIAGMVIEDTFDETKMIFPFIPVSDAKVVASLEENEDAEPYVTFTNERGFYLLKVEPGVYNVEVSKEGYETQAKQVTVEPKEIVKELFILTKILEQ